MHRRSQEMLAKKEYQPVEMANGMVICPKRHRLCVGSSLSSETDDVDCTGEVNVNEDEVGTGEYSINILNDDCLRHVFSYLPKRERIKIERVCKRWQMLSKDMWLRQNHLEFSSFLPVCPTKQVNILKSFLSRCGRNLSRLDVSVRGSILTADVTKVIAKYCRNLHYLSLSGLSFASCSLKYLAPVCGELCSLSVNFCFDASEKDYEILFNASPHLETVSLAGIRYISGKCLLSLNQTHFKSLVLYYCLDLCEYYVYRALLKLKNIVHLSLNWCFESFQHGILSNNLTEVLPRLQSLSLEKSAFLSVKMHQNLVMLSLAFNDSADDRVLETIARNCKKIEKLNISGCCTRLNLLRKVTDKGIKCVASLPNLLDLEMSYLPHVTDESLIAIACYCNLRRLVCRKCSKIGDEGFSRVITSCNELKFLDLSGCKKVGISTVENALKAVKLRSNDISLRIIVGGTSIVNNIQAYIHPQLSIDSDDSSDGVESDYEFEHEFEFDFLIYDSDDYYGDVES